MIAATLRDRLSALSAKYVAITLGVTAGLLILIWAFALERMQHERETAIAAEIQKNANLAQSHEERATRSFDVLDQILLFLRADYQRNGLPKSLTERLREAQVDKQYLGIAAFIGPQGQLLATTGPDRAQNYADREYFKTHAADPVDRLLIGKPIIGRSNGKAVITFSRRLTRADGSFGGVVLLSIDPAYFTVTYGKTAQSKYGSMALIGTDGIIRARRTGNQFSFGDDNRASQVFKELAKSPTGHYISASPSDGHRRIVAYRQLENYPMITAVGSSLEEVLALSRERENVYRYAALLGTLLVLGGLAILYTITVRRAQTLAIITASEHRYRMLFENSLDAVISTRADGCVLAANAAACTMFGRSASEMQALTRARLFDPADHRCELLLASEATRGEARGEVTMLRADGSPFEAEVSVSRYPDGSQRASMIIRDISERKAADDQIKALAFYDPLTRLPNRRLLMDRLQMALAAGARHPRRGALLFLDLDNFKTLNDTLGHLKGDVLLQEVARRLSACIRESDTCARLGGDEFVVMLEDLSENPQEATRQAETVAEKIQRAVSLPYALDAQTQYQITPSIGVTLFEGNTDEDIDEPLKRADLAMYQAKAAGRNTLRFFDPQTQENFAQRATLEVSLRAAVQRQDFILHYQPQITDKKQVTGAEVLLRWQHPERGMVSPAEFIPMAEDTGLILPLGQWVLETACAQLARWAEQPGLRELSLSVNVSERQFRHKDFVAQVLETLARTGARPQQLKLELTEGLLATNIEDIAGKMVALREQGVGFSMDDFGTGYSSLSYLKRLPLDQLKINQSFVRDVLIDHNDAAIARMVIVLANSLGLDVIAEGVETEAQRDFLAAQGCQAYQGYLFSRPLPLAEFEAYVQTMG